LFRTKLIVILFLIKLCETIIILLIYSILLSFFFNVLGTGFADICVGLSNPQVFYSDPNNTIGTVMCTFDAVVEDNKITWPRLQWLFECMYDLFFLLCLK